MIDLLRLEIEKENSKILTKALNTARVQQNINKVYHGFQLIITIICFVIILLSYTFIPQNYLGSIIQNLVLFIVFLIILWSQIKKMNYKFINKLLNKYNKIFLKINKAKEYDLFFGYYWIAILLIIFVIVLFFLIIVNKPNSNLLDVNTKSTLNQIMTYTIGLLAGQIALFTFMFGPIIGKYSFKIGYEIIKHKVIVLLWGYTVVSFINLNLLLLYGIPEFLKNSLIFIYIFFHSVALIMIIFVANRGCDTSKVILYSGFKFSKKIKKYLKPPINYQTDKSKIFWSILAKLGLDFRNVDRMNTFMIPSRSSYETKELIQNLIYVAYKAIKDEEMEILQASMISISYIIDEYIKRRAKYSATNDLVFNMLAEEFDRLLEVSSKSHNENLITKIIILIGHIGQKSLLIDTSINYIKSENKLTIPKEHKFSKNFMFVLQSSFDYCKDFMRSTAQLEIIHQLELIAFAGLHNEYFDVLSRYRSIINDIHKKCLKMPSDYHMFLACECIKYLLRFYAIISRQAIHNHNALKIYRYLRLDLTEMFERQIPNEKVIIGQDDSIQILTLRTNSDQFILQDIFYIILTAKITNSHEAMRATKHIEELIELIIRCSQKANLIQANNSHSFIKALYEISYFIFKGIPKDLIDNQNGKPDDIQYTLNKKIIEACSRLFPTCYTIKDTISEDWRRYYFSIIGMAIIHSKDNNDKLLDGLIFHLILDDIIGKIKKEQDKAHKIHDSNYDYLQLIGAWTSHFFKDQFLSDYIIKFIDINRYEGKSYNGKYTCYGYPSLFHSDFSFSRLINMENYLTTDDHKQLLSWQDRLINESVLISFYEKIQKIKRD